MLILKKRTSRFRDLTNQIINGIEFVEFIETKSKRSIWKVKCHCGNIFKTCASDINRGHTKSCGCSKGSGNKLPYSKASFNALYKAYKYKANKRGIEFILTQEEFGRLTKCNCRYCGIAPQQIFFNRKGNGPYIYNGIDRVNNAIGYTISNVVACCGQCNHAKMTLILTDFKEWVGRLSEHYHTWSNFGGQASDRVVRIINKL